MIPVAIAAAAAFSCTRPAEDGPRKFKAAAASLSGKSRVPYRIDAHVHFSSLAFEHAIGIMDANGISLAANLTPGFTGAGLETATVMAHLTGDRIVNFTNLDWDFMEDAQAFALENKRNLERAKALGAKGVKVSKELGLGVSAGGKLVPVDDPRLAPVWREAGRLNLPVWIHSGDPAAFFKPPTPDNERYKELSIHPSWSFFGPEYPKFEEIIGQFERLVASNPGTVFVGVHFGNYAESPEFVGRMLDKYPNYFIDTAARVPEFGRHPAEKMREFFIKYQDRILFGTDTGIGMTSISLGSGDGKPKTEKDARIFYEAHWRYFETAGKQIDTPTPIQGDWKIDAIDLPTPVLEKLYYKNAERILGISLGVK
jgi:predicted TIM-barrel fold metal-dependent hydrolase